VQLGDEIVLVVGDRAALAGADLHEHTLKVGELLAVVELGDTELLERGVGIGDAKRRLAALLHREHRHEHWRLLTLLQRTAGTIAVLVAKELVLECGDVAGRRLAHAAPLGLLLGAVGRPTTRQDEPIRAE
jgi:hypothetical protein